MSINNGWEISSSIVKEMIRYLHVNLSPVVGGGTDDCGVTEDDGDVSLVGEESALVISVESPC